MLTEERSNHMVDGGPGVLTKKNTTMWCDDPVDTPEHVRAPRAFSGATTARYSVNMKKEAVGTPEHLPRVYEESGALFGREHYGIVPFVHSTGAARRG